MGKKKKLSPLSWPHYTAPETGSLWRLRDDSGGTPRIWFEQLGGKNRQVARDEIILVTHWNETEQRVYVASNSEVGFIDSSWWNMSTFVKLG